jgi:uncharacterized protein YegJ (DUF2314 family)
VIIVRTRTIEARIIAAAIALISSALLPSCSKRWDASLVPPGSPFAEFIGYTYAVYLLPDRAAHGIDPSAAMRNALANEFTSLNLVDAIPREPHGTLVRAHLQKNVKKEFPPPDLSSLQYFGRGISSEEAKKLQASDEAFILEFAYPRQDIWTSLRTANALVEEIARKSHGLIWDDETREIFSPETWHNKRVESWVDSLPEVSTQTTIHAYNNGEYVRAITLGMAKMGLPDVVIENTDWSSNTQVGILINLFCQAIAEGQPIPKNGNFRLVLRDIKNSRLRDAQQKSLKGKAVGVGCLTLRRGKRDQGDPENRLIELEFDRYPGNDVHAKQNSLISSFFGAEESVAKVQRDNEQLLAASARARANLPELHKAFAAGLQPGEFIELKAPFRTQDGGTEWMWVEVTEWKDNQIKGLLKNDPSYVPGLHAGQSVQIREEDVFDYLRRYPTKPMEGNTTSEIIRKINESKEKESPTNLEVIVPPCSSN